MAAAKKLYRSDDSVIAGVCAGLAEYLDVDSAVVRILSVLLLAASGGLAGVLYLIMWLILPPPVVATPGTIPASASADGYQHQRPRQESGYVYAQQPPYAQSGQDSAATEGPSGWAKFGVAVGSVFLAIGIAGLVASVVDGVSWWQLWPAVLILFGIVTIFASSPRVSLAWRISRGLALLAVGVVLLACSTGVLAWSSISLALGQLWPAIFILIGFAIVGAALHNGVLAPAFALCVVLVCVVVVTIYAVPGPLNEVLLEMPFMDIRMLDVNPWR